MSKEETSAAARQGSYMEQEMTARKGEGESDRQKERGRGEWSAV